MTQNWYLIFAMLLLEAFLVSAVLTATVQRAALKWGIVDHPGERKIHVKPVPLLGGVAIYLTVNLVILGDLLGLEVIRGSGFDWIETNVLSFLGEDAQQQLIGISAGAFLIFVLGIVDDLKALSPELKLVGQIVAALVLVLSGMRLDVFISYWLEQFPPTAGIEEPLRGYINVGVSGAITIFWVVLMTNSLNFLDNMDGLCGGVSVIAALSFFLICFARDEFFLCAMLVVFAGAVSGFLYHNLSPARIFMGDAGAMFCGYILATVALLGTYYTGESSSRLAVAAPLLALSVPIFDTLSVVWIRWRRGESIMKGDKRHFSHRLVELGMKPREAVEFIFLVAGVTGLGAALLPRVGSVGTLIILAQAAGVFLLIVLLMRAAQRKDRPS